MGKSFSIVFFAVILLSYSSMSVLPQAFANGDPANLALGQSDLISSDSNLDRKSLSAPLSAITDTSGNLWVADAGNNRVLRYDSGFGVPASASIILGQPDSVSNSAGVSDSELNSPRGLGIDSAGNIWIADTSNNRVLRFAPGATTADFVLGQPDLNSNAANRGGSVDANTLFSPKGIFVVGLDVWVADAGNNRILKFVDPANTGGDADFVLGQSVLTTSSSGVSATALRNPAGVTVVGADVWVADTENNRVLKFINPEGTGKSADLVLGQPNFGSNANNAISVTASTLNKPQAVAVLGTTVWVADGSNNRLLLYFNPTFNGFAATSVLGHDRITEGDPNFVTIDAGTLFSPQSVFVSLGDVWTADSANNRVLKYPSFSTGLHATTVIGQIDFTSNTAGSNLSDTTLSLSRGIVVDNAGNTWVADTANNRVLRFAPGFSFDQPANLVLGQPDFTSNTPNRGGAVAANTLHSPRDLAVDNDGHLWVADTGNSRVLRFAPGATSANYVLGQSDFDTNLPNKGGSFGTPSTMNFPQGIMTLFVPADNDADPPTAAFLAVGVADTGNDRILLFLGLTLSGQAADDVQGGAGDTSDSTLFAPTDLEVAKGGVWVSDTGNNRLIATGPFSSNFHAVIGQPDFTSNSAGVSDSELNSPRGLTVDPFDRLWVVDSGNNRVLAFPPSGESISGTAIHVLGQPNFNSNGANDPGLSDSSLSNPSQVAAVDDSGLILWVADSSNNRVLRYSDFAITDPEPEPEPDRDDDGIPDSNDRCPDEQGPSELDGCPDRDDDGTPDLDDQCPDVQGPRENGGCPEDQGPPSGGNDEILDAINSARQGIVGEIFELIDSLRSSIFNELGEISRSLGDARNEFARTELKVDEINSNVRDNVGDLQFIKDQIAQLQLQTGDGAQKIDISISEADGKESFLILTTVNGVPVDVEIDQILIVKKKGAISILTSDDYDTTAIDTGLFTLKIDKKAFKDKKSIELLVVTPDGTIHGAILFDDKLSKNTSQ